MRKKICTLFIYLILRDDIYASTSRATNGSASISTQFVLKIKLKLKKTIINDKVNLTHRHDTCALV